MLTGLSIAHYTVADKLNIDFEPAMTAITGETGAGKSIALGALGLALGNRSDSSVVRHGADKADISASFDVSQLPHVQQWLCDQDLMSHDEAQQEDLILRRLISKEGRSKAFINSQAVNLQTLKSLGSQLVDIHTQHAHHRLLQRDYHQALLDAYAGCRQLLEQTQACFKHWQQQEQQIAAIIEQEQEACSRKEYLQFQLREFEQLQLQPDEYQQLSQRHKLMANAEQLSQACQHTLELCQGSEQSAITPMLQQCLAQLNKLSEHSKDLANAYDLLNSASIQVEEACLSLRQQLEYDLNDGDSLQTLEARLASIYDVARKHRVNPEALEKTQQALESELSKLDNSDEQLAQLRHSASALHTEYTKLASKLSGVRAKACKKLTGDIKQQLNALGMLGCEFNIELNTDTTKAKASGFEAVEFVVSTNPGMAPQSLQKIASGGELSRISLAIQVITAKSSTIPTLVFDEVDVGIGGATAEVVGRLLKELGASAQILCVTHQPQVAAKAQQHFQVSKTSNKGETSSAVKVLSEAEKIEEIARMLGGLEITARTLEHAEEMLSQPA